MRKVIAIVATSVALAFAGQHAQACTGQHFSVTNTSAGDTPCIFNVTVAMDDAYTSILEGYGAPFGGFQGSADYIASQLNGQGDGGSVNITNANLGFATGEGDIQFTVPAGVGEVTVTVTGSDGSVASSSDVLVNGAFESPAAAGGAGGCAPPPPPLPPVNTAIPGPGLDPDDNKAAMNDLQKGSVPLNDHDGDDMGHRTGRVQ